MLTGDLVAAQRTGPARKIPAFHDLSPQVRTRRAPRGAPRPGSCDGRVPRPARGPPSKRARSVTQFAPVAPRPIAVGAGGRGTPRNTARVFLVVPRPASLALDRGARSGILG